MSADAAWTVALVGAYLVGSIPFGLLLGLARGVDIREHGSRNIGATNAMRVLGKKLGALCFALDVLKGALPTALAGAWLGWLGARDLSAGESWRWMAVAGAAILGHVFPIWLRLKGGKGVATGFGAMLAIWPAVTPAALGALAVWVLVARVTRYVGVASCAAAVSLPALIAALAAAWVTVKGVGAAWSYIAATGALAALVLWRHRGNLARTIAGTEHRIGGRTGGR